MNSRKEELQLFYPNGEVILVGDILAPGYAVDGQVARIVVVIPTLCAAEGYDAREWAHLESGVLVEHRNASGLHLVHYPVIDEDFELLERTICDHPRSRSG